MYIANRTFMHPVLCADTDDYIDSKFDVKYKTEQKDLNMLCVCFLIELDNLELKELIANDMAEYAVHVECAYTGYRTIIRGKSPKIDVPLRIHDIKDKVEFVVMIVAKQDLIHYSNTKLNKDYNGKTIPYIPKSSILAYENIDELRVTKNIEEFQNSSSIFTVKCVPEDAKKYAIIDLNSHKVIILLPREQYLIYISAMNQNDMQPIVNTLVIFPALIYLLEEIQVADSVYDGKMWYRSLCSAFEKKNKDLLWELENKGAYVLAQEIMESPLYNALLGIKAMKP